MPIRKPIRRRRSTGLAVQKAMAALMQDTKSRERLVSFGISCCLHVLLLLTLSLIAIGTGAVSDPMLLIAAPFDTEKEDVALAPEPDWMLEPDLPEAPTDNRPIEMAIVDLEASSEGFAKVNLDSTPPQVETPVEDSKPRKRAGKGEGNELQGMQAMAAKGIQTRVSKAGGKKGEVQFALAWKNFNDLDLHVIAPSGEHISHQYRRSNCGGMLDVDMNVKVESDEPVENVRWLRNAPWGRYTILINFFQMHTEGVRRPQRENPYQLLAQLGEESVMRENVAGFGPSQVTVWRFNYVPASINANERVAMLEQLEKLQEREEELAKPMLDEARLASGQTRQRMLQNIIQMYPHTDTAIQALQMVDGVVKK